ncbi:odorant receptor 13a-like [Hylaeus anthracinus]|uniref:odorant receptor 13a-like n=1 Tax=Hylaeus anthracinus TaxID=313031 RepID=UPI0023B9B395|nr:odorant receptor 13a-like [Hylaeus anthracinus]
MIFGHSDDISIAMTSHFMKFSGFWMATNYVEQKCRNFALVYTIIGMLLLGSVQVVELYYSRGDFGTCLYILCNVLSLCMSLFKILILLEHKKDFFQLILYLQQKFLHGIYDDHEKKIVGACKRVCAFFICVFTCCAHATVFSYVLSPIVVNIGRNETDRVLPFQMRISLISLTPYFEITFVLQALFLYQVGVCYFCFDNLLCIINLHVSSQFRILQYRMENMQTVDKEKDSDSLITCKSHSTDKCYSIFKTCIQQHQALITYCSKLEKVFSSFSLGQVLVFSVLICLGGYQVLMSNAPFATRMIFIFHIMGCTAQLFMFTYSCDCLIQDSTNIATAMYAAPWSRLPMDKDGRTLRKDLILVILRSRVPCCLTANKFFPISLETYTGIMSTAMSYFTLLKGRTVDTT